MMIDDTVLLSANLLVPTGYAVTFDCTCGCPERGELAIVPAPGVLAEDDGVLERMRASARWYAEVLEVNGYRNVRVEPRYDTPKVGLN
jgi:hypothetical protein